MYVFLSLKGMYLVATFSTPTDKLLFASLVPLSSWFQGKPPQDLYKTILSSTESQL